MIFYQVIISLQYGEDEVFCQFNKQEVIDESLDFIETLGEDDKELDVMFYRFSISVNKESVRRMLIGSNYANAMNNICHTSINDFEKRYKQ